MESQLQILGQFSIKNNLLSIQLSKEASQCQFQEKNYQKINDTNIKSSPSKIPQRKTNNREKNLEEKINKSNKWSNQETQSLFSKYNQLGSCWSSLVKFFQGRTQNNLKNKFFGNIRKLERRINNVGKQCKILRKKLKFQLFMRPSEYIEAGLTSNIHNRDIAFELKQRVLDQAMFQPHLCPKEICLKLIQDLNNFSKATRSYGSKQLRAYINKRNKGLNKKNQPKRDQIIQQVSVSYKSKQRINSPTCSTAKQFKTKTQIQQVFISPQFQNILIQGPEIDCSVFYDYHMKTLNDVGSQGIKIFGQKTPQFDALSLNYSQNLELNDLFF